MYGIKLKKVRGYFTVESALIIPLTILLICSVFYLTYYLYNRCVVSQDAYILAFRGSLCCDRSSEEVRQYVLEQGSKQFGNKYIAIKDLNSTVEADNQKVTVEATGKTKASLAEQLVGQRQWTFQIKREAHRICPTEFIRNVRAIKKLIKE